MSYLYLDFETFSEADLKKVGSYAYAEPPIVTGKQIGRAHV